MQTIVLKNFIIYKCTEDVEIKMLRVLVEYVSYLQLSTWVPFHSKIR